jgi:hypothetical protein
MEDEVREIGGRGTPGARTYLALLEELREISGDDEPRIHQYLVRLLGRLHRLSRPRRAADFVRSARLALKRRKDQRKIADGQYRTRLSNAREQGLKCVHHELIMHLLSRLHSATPPEKELRTSKSSALNSSRKEPCRLTWSASGPPLAPT